MNEYDRNIVSLLSKLFKHLFPLDPSSPPPPAAKGGKLYPTVALKGKKKDRIDPGKPSAAAAAASSYAVRKKRWQIFWFWWKNGAHNITAFQNIGIAFQFFTLIIVGVNVPFSPSSFPCTWQSLLSSPLPPVSVLRFLFLKLSPRRGGGGNENERRGFVYDWRWEMRQRSECVRGGGGGGATERPPSPLVSEEPAKRLDLTTALPGRH